MILLIYSHIEKDIHQKLLEYTLKNFPDDFQYKISQFRRWQDAQLSMLGRLILLKGLEKLDLKKENIHFGYNKHGKPYLKNTTLNFNISHSGDFVICALSTDGDIGVDIELIQEIDVDDFEHQMTVSEFERINNAINKNQEFFNYWTRKEAVLKACGDGLTGIDLKSFEVLNNKVIIKHEEYILHQIDISPKYMCHVAIKSSSNKATGIEISLNFFNANSFCVPNISK